MGQPPAPNFFCKNCGHREYIKFSPMDDPLEKCPKCGSENVTCLHIKEFID